ncbi:MAG: thiamine phosphate synthase [Campylobacter sp.]|uniref:thiamine phosphate synthase n=1 Tax=Campylobacter sp. TaxID=205 RepID=UPI001B456F54|nr:thiamine phosphate synthase [Campylobacter sp.]MBP3675868.1 thiamine phosphate synthase [Campylobacter sp.]
MIKYAISDPKFYSNLDYAFNNFIRLKEANMLLFRDKNSNNHDKTAQEFIKFRSNNRTFLLQNDIDLACKFGFDGIHFSSNFIHLLKDTPLNLIKIASTHNIKEIELANQYGADFITFSPIFATPNKGEPKGLEALKEAVKMSKAKVIALGGIMSAEQICAVMKCGVAGFASIRYFTLD